VVIGDGPERGRLEGLAAEAGVHVRWVGQLDHEDALRELARCHVMALPSVDEAFGVAYVEALACGVPAIGSRGEGGPEEIAAMGGGMLLVPPREAAALADTMAEVLSDADARERLATEARRTAAQHFSWEACGRATLAAYSDVMRASDE
jgi:glycosyltransferase involved in cell wall biosynthesis